MQHACIMTEPKSERDRCNLRHKNTAAKAALVESLKIIFSRLLGDEATSKRVFEIPHTLPSFYTQSPLVEFKFLRENLDQ